PLVRHILFVCTQNADRSQMAAAFFDRLAPADVRADTAGTRPGERIHPAVVEAMRERGLDLSRRRPRLLTVEEQLRASQAVTLSCDGRCSFV
uniref:arsenate-mycothiol transferase ArsC n=1 Tax=Leadbetterella sp. DM7 TaxID=3235085 RepID=UPI00349EBCF1